MSATDLETSYRRMLRWYPRQWRSRNEDAVTGVLLDQAEHEARTAPSTGERLSLIAGGLHERFLRAERPSPLHLAALGTALVFSVWYLVVIAWGSGARYFGTLGPFANPSVITAAVFALAAVLAAARRMQLARLVSLLAAACALSMFALASALTWLGPGPSPTLIFVGLGLVGALRGGTLRQALLLIAAFASAGLAATVLRSMVMTLPYVWSAQFWVWGILVAVSTLATLTLVLMAANTRAAEPAPRTGSR